MRYERPSLLKLLKGGDTPPCSPPSKIFSSLATGQPPREDTRESPPTGLPAGRLELRALALPAPAPLREHHVRTLLMLGLSSSRSGYNLRRGTIFGIKIFLLFFFPLPKMLPSFAEVGKANTLSDLRFFR